MAALDHLNVVTVYDAGEADGLLYIAMQFVEGSNLAFALRRAVRLRPYRALDTLRQVASALDGAHAVGPVHPRRQAGQRPHEGRHAYLTDFGLTKRIDASRTAITRAVDIVGTIHYVAPEQTEGGEVAARRSRSPATPRWR